VCVSSTPTEASAVALAIEHTYGRFVLGSFEDRLARCDRERDEYRRGHRGGASPLVADFSGLANQLIKERAALKSALSELASDWVRVRRRLNRLAEIVERETGSSWKRR
jgi:hypothetical protein